MDDPDVRLAAKITTGILATIGAVCLLFGMGGLALVGQAAVVLLLVGVSILVLFTLVLLAIDIARHPEHSYRCPPPPVPRWVYERHGPDTNPPTSRVTHAE